MYLYCNFLFYVIEQSYEGQTGRYFIFLFYESENCIQRVVELITQGLTLCMKVCTGLSGSMRSKLLYSVASGERDDSSEH